MKAALLFLLVATAVAAQKEPARMEQSTCWTCHAPGSWEPPMVAPKATFEMEGVQLQMTVKNTWLDEMQGLRAFVDTDDQRVAVPAPAGRTGYVQKDGSLDLLPLQTARAEHAIDIQPRFQYAIFNVTIESMHDPYIALQLFSPAGQRLTMATADFDGALAVLNPRHFAEFGWGEYKATIEAQPRLLATPETVSYSLEVDLADAGGPWDGAVATANVIAPGEEAVVEWTLFSQGKGRANLPVDLFYTSYYEHESASDPDRAFLVAIKQVELRSDLGVWEVVGDDKPKKGSPLPFLLPLVLALAARWKQGETIA